MTDPVDVVGDAIEDAKEEATSDTRWETLNARLQAIESRSPEPPDLSPIESRLTELGESVTGGLSGLAERLAALETAKAETRTETRAEPPEEAPRIAPQIDTKTTAKAHIKERTPRVSHFLFRRIGGNRG